MGAIRQNHVLRAWLIYFGFSKAGIRCRASFTCNWYANPVDLDHFLRAQSVRNHASADIRYRASATPSEVNEQLREALKYSPPRRKPGSSSLNFLDSGVRRNDESAIDQRLLSCVCKRNYCFADPNQALSVSIVSKSTARASARNFMRLLAREYMANA